MNKFLNLAKYHQNKLIQTQSRTVFNLLTKRDPIKYHTTKIVPYSQENFFNVVMNLQDYKNFIPWITESSMVTESIEEHFESGVRRGRFDAKTKIGFQALNFAYMSHISYEEPNWLISEDYNSKIFESLYSHWEIKRIEQHVCEVNYNIQMTFHNPLYYTVTTTFFDYLANNINKAFEQRCHELYYKDNLVNVARSGKTSTRVPGKDQTDNTIEKVQKQQIYFTPEDSWIWDINNQNTPVRADRYKHTKPSITAHVDEDVAMQHAHQVKTQRDIILESIKRVMKNGYIKEFSLEQIQKAIESSEMLLRELRNLHEAFGRDETNSQVYARHLNDIFHQLVQQQD